MKIDILIKIVSMKERWKRIRKNGQNKIFAIEMKGNNFCKIKNSQINLGRSKIIFNKHDMAIQI